MRSGRLNRRVVFKARKTTTDEYGEQLDYTDVIATRWASIEPISAKEYLSDAGITTDVTTRIITRYDAGTAAVNAADFIVYGDTVYNIESIINTRTENRELVFVCSSGNRESGN